MPRIKFTQAYQVKGASYGKPPEKVKTGEDDSPKYAEGDEIEVSEASARHFINRRVAVLVTAKEAKAHSKTDTHDKK